MASQKLLGLLGVVYYHLSAHLIWFMAGGGGLS